jgi:hypothetical protein
MEPADDRWVVRSGIAHGVLALRLSVAAERLLAERIEAVGLDGVVAELLDELDGPPTIGAVVGRLNARAREAA